MVIQSRSSTGYPERAAAPAPEPPTACPAALPPTRSCRSRARACGPPSGWRLWTTATARGPLRARYGGGAGGGRGRWGGMLRAAERADAPPGRGAGGQRLPACCHASAGSPAPPALTTTTFHPHLPTPQQIDIMMSRGDMAAITQAIHFGPPCERARALATAAAAAGRAPRCGRCKRAAAHHCPLQRRCRPRVSLPSHPRTPQGPPTHSPRCPRCSRASSRGRAAGTPTPATGAATPSSVSGAAGRAERAAAQAARQHASRHSCLALPLPPCLSSPCSVHRRIRDGSLLQPCSQPNWRVVHARRRLTSGAV